MISAQTFFLAPFMIEQVCKRLKLPSYMVPLLLSLSIALFRLNLKKHFHLNVCSRLYVENSYSSVFLASPDAIEVMLETILTNFTDVTLVSDSLSEDNY